MKELRDHHGAVKMWPQDRKGNGCSLVLYIAEVVCCGGHGTNKVEGGGSWPEGSPPLVLVCDMIPR